MLWSLNKSTVVLEAAWGRGGKYFQNTIFVTKQTSAYCLLKNHSKSYLEFYVSGKRTFCFFSILCVQSRLVVSQTYTHIYFLLLFNFNLISRNIFRTNLNGRINIWTVITRTRIVSEYVPFSGNIFHRLKSKL